MAEAGFKHPHAFVLGTAGSTPIPTGGFYSPGAFWSGGAGGFLLGGYTSLLAFWMGGACGRAGITPPQPPEEERHAAGKKKAKDEYRDSDLLILIPMMLAVIESD